MPATAVKKNSPCSTTTAERMKEDRWYKAISQHRKYMGRKILLP
jgi:hypothetical protein